MVRKLQIIREIFKGDHNAVAAETEVKTNKRPFREASLVIHPC